MRVAVVFFAEKKREKVLTLAKGLARGVESSGHRVDIIDGLKDINTKLTIYEYIAIGCESLSLFSGKISEKIPVFLMNAGMVHGKRCFAFVLNHPLSANRALARLMKAMEHEGMYLKYSEILTSLEQAEGVGKRLGV